MNNATILSGFFAIATALIGFFGVVIAAAIQRGKFPPIFWFGIGGLVTTFGCIAGAIIGFFVAENVRTNSSAQSPSITEPFSVMQV